MRIMLALALGLAATAAQAQTVALYGDHAVCSRVEVVAKLTDTSIGKADWERRLNAEIRNGRCAVVPQGTEVSVDSQQGMFTCIRPVGLRVCGWTVMHPAQLQ